MIFILQETEDDLDIASKLVKNSLLSVDGQDSIQIIKMIPDKVNVFERVKSKDSEIHLKEMVRYILMVLLLIFILFLVKVFYFQLQYFLTGLYFPL